MNQNSLQKKQVEQLQDMFLEIDQILNKVQKIDDKSKKSDDKIL